jgi:superfamily I DNA/RNA helicase
MTSFLLMKHRIYHRFNGRCLKLLKKNSKHVILAGDDDQAIYGWAGADVKRFQQEPAKEIVLPQSYRVPKLIQRHC